MDKKIIITIATIIILALTSSGLKSRMSDSDKKDNQYSTTTSEQASSTKVIDSADDNDDDIEDEDEYEDSSANTKANINTSANINVNVSNSTNSKNSAKTYTMTEVAKHASQSDCWTAVRGGVYNLTSFFGQHPGGDKNLAKLCGIDGTSMFETKHGGSYRPEQELASLKIGVLVK